MFKKLIEGMCPLSKTVIKISALLPFLIIPSSIIFFLITKNAYISENFKDVLTFSVAAPTSAVIVALLGDLVWRDKK